MQRKICISGLLLSGLLSACGGTDTASPDTDPHPDNDTPPDVVTPPISSTDRRLTINEIVAKSNNDSFLSGNDWIELHNSGSQSVNLADYALADDSSDIISLPEMLIAPGDYIVIAAVDSEEENPPMLSVPFKLGSEDSVTLYDNGQEVDFISWPDGQASAGTSYGLLDNTMQTAEPTPGAANKAREIDPVNDLVRGNPTGNSDLKINEVVAKSDRPDFHNGADWIELINSGSAAIDLSDYAIGDDNNDVEYLPPITLQPGEYAIVIAGGDTPEDGALHLPFGLGREDSVSLFHNLEEVDYISWGRDESKNGRSYGYIGGEAHLLYPTPSTGNVPYVIFSQEEVFTVRVDIPQADWQAILADPGAEQYYPADFELNGGVIKNVGFRIKGQGSLMFVRDSKRYGFKVDMNEYQDQKFMGMKKLVLNQSFADPSYMRDVLSYKLMREAGVPAPETSFVDLWVSGEHMGLYQLVEMVDTEFVERHFPEDHDTVGKGDLYKGEIGQRLIWSDSNIASYSSGLRLKSNRDTLGTPEEGASLISFLDSINHGPDRLAQVDTDLMVKYLAASVLNGNMDSHIGGTANNFYLYEQRSKDVFTMIPWDYNLAYGMWGDGPAISVGGGFGGGFGGGPNCRVVEHVIDNPVHDSNSTRPLIDAILQNPDLKQQYHAELQRLLDTAYDSDYLEAEIMRMADLIDPYVQADPTKYFTYQEWRTSLTQDLPSDSDNSGGRGANTYGPAPGLINFIRQRADNVQRQLNGEIPSSNSGGTACP